MKKSERDFLFFFLDHQAYNGEGCQFDKPFLLVEEMKKYLPEKIDMIIERHHLEDALPTDEKEEKSLEHKLNEFTKFCNFYNYDEGFLLKNLSMMGISFLPKENKSLKEFRQMLNDGATIKAINPGKVVIETDSLMGLEITYPIKGE
jgi:hypothetical protein